MPMPESPFLVYVLYALLAVAALAGLHFWLRGRDMSAYDGLVTPQHFPGSPPGHPDQQGVLAMLARLKPLFSLPLREQIPALRRFMDEMFADQAYAVRFVPVDTGGIRGEWVLAPGASPSRRTLYIHGGAFTMGSPRSHRPITSRFAEITRGAVFAVDYRLMPEHSRQAGIDDCRAAYRWLLENGPDGPGPANAVFVAGDSAGGNLTLSLIAWVRDEGVRPADAAIALSPLTDASFGTRSMYRNFGTDPMLAPLVPWIRWPRPVVRVIAPWIGFVMMRHVPHAPAVSPLRGDLAGLPPVLIQVSGAEMLLDDSLRYAGKARAAGSDVRVQAWDHMVHVWQVFGFLRESREAFEEIARFIDGVRPVSRNGA